MLSSFRGLSLTEEQEPAIKRKREGDKSRKEFQLLAAATVLEAFELFSALGGFVRSKRNQKVYIGRKLRRTWSAAQIPHPLLKC